MEDLPECPICFEPLAAGGPRDAPVSITPCGHAFCGFCIRRVARSAGGEAPCPLCRAPVRLRDVVDAPEEAPGDLCAAAPPPAAAGGGEASKTRALLNYIAQTAEGEKVVVFSQFTRYLERCRGALRRDGRFRAVMYTGQMDAGAKAEALRAFKGGEEKVLLISLRCGGVGLNLVEANHALLMDPWWNRAVEDQALCRVWRLGQQRPVTVARFVAERTIEERMIELQRAKAHVAAAALASHGEPGAGESAAERRRRQREERISLVRSLLDASAPAPAP